MEFLHPLDAGLKVTTYIPLDPNDELIGEEVDNIRVAEPGERLTEVMGWLYNRITRYPYYWPKEGTYIDKFGYDFEVELLSENQVNRIDITQIAYDMLKAELNIQPPDPDNTTDVDIQNDVVSGGGVLVKLSVTLDKAQPVSELSIAPFTKYPMELVSLMYEEDIETYHPKKEIIKPKKNTAIKEFTQTATSIRFQFPVVVAKRFTIILRQKNNEKNTYLVNPADISKKSLWAKVSKIEAELTLDMSDNVETLKNTDSASLKGWDVYLSQLAKYQKSLMDWKKKLKHTSKNRLKEKLCLNKIQYQTKNLLWKNINTDKISTKQLINTKQILRTMKKVTVTKKQHIRNIKKILKSTTNT
ncbi:hypothetical protein QO179_24535 [Bacillus stercoris]|nr:hypothetical protein [Bacillus stercoris]